MGVPMEPIKRAGAFDRYHFWEQRPHPGEEEYLRFVRFGYFVRPSYPWDGTSSIINTWAKETPH